MKIGIFVNPNRDIKLNLTDKLTRIILCKHGDAVVKEINDSINVKNSEKDFLQDSDIIISVGGDGTFLNAARKAFLYDKPILGLNCGNLGFLTEEIKDNLELIIERLLTKDFRIENRMVLETSIDGVAKKHNAINEVVVSRGDISRIVNIKLLLNDSQIDHFPADGVLVSTPTGSTAYSLSAGGPIVEPGMELMLITPICPHILHARPIVVSDNKKITVLAEDKHQSTSVVTFDGQDAVSITNNTKVEIKKSDNYLKVIKLTNKNFYDIVREKLFNRKIYC